MTLEAFYFIAQIIAAAAVVASLVFVGTQIKAQVAEHRQVRIQTRTESVGRFYDMLARDAGSRQIFIEGLASFRGLTPQDRIQFDNLMSMIARTALIYERQFLDGDITKKSFADFVSYMTPFWGSPGCAEWIEARGHEVFGTAWVHVDPIIASSEGRRAYEAWHERFGAPPAGLGTP